MKLPSSRWRKPTPLAIVEIPLRVGPTLVRATVPREGLWLTQTPQAFDLDLLREAHRRAAAEGFFATDDAALVERMGCPVRMIRGSRDNLKLTTVEDLALAEALLCCPRKTQR